MSYMSGSLELSQRRLVLCTQASRCFQHTPRADTMTASGKVREDKTECPMEGGTDVEESRSDELRPGDEVMYNRARRGKRQQNGAGATGLYSAKVVGWRMNEAQARR